MAFSISDSVTKAAVPLKDAVSQSKFFHILLISYGSNVRQKIVIMGFFFSPFLQGFSW